MARLQIILAAVITQSLCGGASILPRRPSESTLIDRNEPVIAISSPPVVLAPVRPLRRGNTKRDRRAALELKPEETLYWSGADGTAAKLTVAMPGASENIVNLELVDDMVQKVSCPSDGAAGPFKLQFAEAADLDDAQDVWQWVNQADENSFLMIVGAGTCGWNEGRIVYNVSGLAYDDSEETAVLSVQPTTWKEAAHTFDLTVGQSAALESGAGRRRRTRRHSRRGFLSAVKGAAKGAVGAVSDAAGKVVDTVGDAAGEVVDTVGGAADEFVDDAGEFVDDAGEFIDDAGEAAGQVFDTLGDAAGEVVDDVGGAINPDISPDFTVPFASDFSNKSVTFSQDGVDIGASCVKCFTTGGLRIRGRFRASQFQLQEAWIEASTSGLSASALLALTLKGELTGTLAEKSVPVFKASPAGLSIPGVLTIGPTVSVSLGAEFSKVKGGVTVSFGGTATIPPSTALLDFLSEDDTTSSGWDPSFDAEPFKADALIEASASAFLKAAVGLEISAVETGFLAEITAKLPSLSATLKGISSATCTACGDFQNGLQGSLNLGTSIDVSLKKKVLGDEEPLWGITLAQAQTPPLGSFCKGFGLQGEECLAA